MKKILLLLFITCSYFISTAQTRLGYGAEGYLNARYLAMSGSGTNGTNGTGTNNPTNGTKLGSFDVGVKYSILGNLIFQDEDRKFFLGDFVDVGLGVAFYKPVAFNVQLGFGLASSYRFTKDLEIGVRYTHWKGDLFFDYAQNPGFVHTRVFAPSVRLKNIMITAGLGKTPFVIVDNHKGLYLMSEIRYLFDPNESESYYLGFKIENYNGKSTDSNINSKLNGFFIGITAGVFGLN